MSASLLRRTAVLVAAALASAAALLGPGGAAAQSCTVDPRSAVFTASAGGVLRPGPACQYTRHELRAARCSITGGAPQSTVSILPGGPSTRSGLLTRSRWVNSVHFPSSPAVLDFLTPDNLTLEYLARDVPPTVASLPTMRIYRAAEAAPAPWGAVTGGIWVQQPSTPDPATMLIVGTAQDGREPFAPIAQVVYIDRPEDGTLYTSASTLTFRVEGHFIIPEQGTTLHPPPTGVAVKVGQRAETIAGELYHDAPVDFRDLTYATSPIVLHENENTFTAYLVWPGYYWSKDEVTVTLDTMAPVLTPADIPSGVVRGPVRMKFELLERRPEDTRILVTHARVPFEGEPGAGPTTATHQHPAPGIPGTVWTPPELTQFYLPDATEDGDYTAVGSSRDRAGHVSAPHAPVAFTIDTRPPQIALSGPPDGGITRLTGVVSLRVADLTLVSTGPAIAVTRDPDGAAGPLPEEPLPGRFADTDPDPRVHAATDRFAQDGLYRIHVAASDQAGNMSAADLTFTVDKTVPVITLGAPTAGSWSAEPVVLSWSAEDLNLEGTTSRLLRLLPQGGSEVVHEPLPASTTVDTDGTYRVEIEAVDRAGNTATRERTFSVDRTPPAIALVAPAEGSWTRDASARVEGTYDEANVASVTVNGQPATAAGGRFSAVVTLSAGANTITAHAVDKAGNASSPDPTRSVSLDAGDPTVVITLPAENALLATGRVEVRAEAQDTASGIASLRIGAQAFAPAPPGASSFSAVAHLTLPDGAQQVEAEATDRAGRTARATVPFQIDTRCDFIGIERPRDAALVRTATLAVEGSASDPRLSSVDVRAGAGAWAPATFTGGRFAGSVTLAEGFQDVEARARDAAGNECSHSVRVVLDATAPRLDATDPEEGRTVGLATPVVLTFSEDLAPASATAATLPVRVGGQSVPARIAVAGAQVTILPEGEAWPGSADLVVEATAGLEDLAGNALANPTTLTLHRADLEPPTLALDALPATTSDDALDVCGLTQGGAAAVEVTGHLEAAAATPGGDGRFCARLRLEPGVTNQLQAVAVDAAGNRSLPAVAYIDQDPEPPVVVLARLEGAEVRVGFSKDVDAATVTLGNVFLTDGEDPLPDIEAFASGPREATVRALPGGPDLTTTPFVLWVLRGVRDLVGNNLAYPHRQLFNATGDAFVTGEVYDDATGLRVEGVRVEALQADGSPIEPVPSDVTGADGSYAVGVPAGDLVVHYVHDGYTRAFRRLDDVAGGLSRRAFDVRLTPLGGPFGIPSTGGSARDASGEALLSVPDEAINVQLSLWITRVSRQGLRGELPYGWSPVYAVDVEPTSGQGVSFDPPATLTVPNHHQIQPGSEVVVATYDEGSFAWLVLGTATLSADRLSLRGAIDGAGQVAFLVADVDPVAPPPAVVGEPLAGVPPDQVPHSGWGGAPLEATLTFTPDAVLADGQSSAAVRFRGRALTSGTRLQADLAEGLTTSTGEELAFPAYTADLSSYNLPEAAAEAESRFAVKPENAERIAVFREGEVAARITDFPETAAGALLAPGGGDVASGGVTLRVPAGAVEQATPVEMGRVALAELPLAVPPDFEAVAAVDLRFGGRPLLVGARLEVAPQGAEVFPEGDYYALRAGAVARQSRWLLVARATKDADGVLRSSDHLDPATLFPHVRDEGVHVFARVTNPAGAGVVHGRVTEASGAPSDALVLAPSGVGGRTFSPDRYALVTAVGAARALSARSLTTGDAGSAVLDVASGDQLRDFALAETPPAVVSTDPVNEARHVGRTVTVAANMSEAMDPRTLAGNVTATAAGSPVEGAVLMEQAQTRILFRPRAPLPANVEVVVTLRGGASGLKDRDGRALAADHVFRFHTIDVEVPRPPAEGRLLLWAPGAHTYSGPSPAVQCAAAERPQDRAYLQASPGAVPANATITVFNLERVCSVTFEASELGAFDLLIAGLPGERLQVTITTRGGQSTTFVLSTYLEAGGQSATVGAEGGVFTTVDGVRLEVPAGAFAEPTRVGFVKDDLQANPWPTPLPGGFEVPIAGQLTLEGKRSALPLRVDFPLPADVAPVGEDDSALVVTTMSVLGTEYPQFLAFGEHVERDGQAFVATTRPPIPDDPTEGGDAAAPEGEDARRRGASAAPTPEMTGECGDGTVDEGEECDDGNLAEGDGCSEACQMESCGNGRIDPGEQCDDGNLSDADTCSRQCRRQSVNPLLREWPGVFEERRIGAMIARNIGVGLLMGTVASFGSAAVGNIGDLLDWASPLHGGRGLFALPIVRGEPITVSVLDQLTGRTLFGRDLGALDPVGRVYELPTILGLDDEDPPSLLALEPLEVRVFALTRDNIAVRPGVVAQVNDGGTALPPNPPFTLRILGEEGSVLPFTRVIATNLTRDEHRETTAGAGGAFEVPLTDVEPDDRIVVAFEAQNVDAAPRLSLVASEPLPDLAPGDVVIEGPNGEVAVSAAAAAEGGRRWTLVTEQALEQGAPHTLVVRRLADAAGNVSEVEVRLPFRTGSSPLLSQSASEEARDSARHGAYLYVAAGAEGVRVLDISDPKNIEVVKTVREMDTVRSVEVFWARLGDPPPAELQPYLAVAGGGVRTVGFVKVYPLRPDPTRLSPDEDWVTVVSDYDEVGPDGNVGLYDGIPGGHPTRIRIAQSFAVAELVEVESFRAGSEHYLDLTFSPPVSASALDPATVRLADSDGRPLVERLATPRELLDEGERLRVHLRDLELATPEIEVRLEDALATTSGSRRNRSFVQWMGYEQNQVLYEAAPPEQQEDHVLGFVAVTSLGFELLEVTDFTRTTPGPPRRPTPIYSLISEARSRDLGLLNQYVADWTAATPRLRPVTTLVTSQAGGALILYDIEDPHNPRALSGIPFTGLAGGIDVVEQFELPSGELADLVFMTNARDGVLVFDVTEREFPVLRGHIHLAGSHYNVVVDAERKLAYLSAGEEGVKVLDVSNPFGEKSAEESAALVRQAYAASAGANVNGPVNIDEELGLVVTHGTGDGVKLIRSEMPRCRFLLEQDEEAYTNVADIVPLGVENPAERPVTSPVRLAMRLPGGIVPDEDPTLRVRVQGLDGYGHPCRDVQLDGLRTWAEVPLRRVSDDKADERYHLFMSEPVAFTADPEQRDPDHLTLLAGDVETCTLLEGNQTYIEAAELPATEGRAGSFRVEWKGADRPEPASGEARGAGDVFGTMLQSGEAVLHEEDLTTRARSMGFSFKREHRSQAIYAGPLGRNWDSPLFARLRYLPNGDVEYYGGDGRVDRFVRRSAPDPSGCWYDRPDGYFGCLDVVPDGLRYVDRKNQVQVFDRQGRLARVEGNNQRNALTLGRDALGRVVAVRDELGRLVTLEYDAQDRVSRIEDWSGRRVVYGYGGIGEHEDALTSITFVERDFDGAPRDLVTRYSYQERRRGDDSTAELALAVRAITSARGHEIVRYDYQGGNRVVGQVWGDPEDDITIGYSGNTTTVTDRNGNVTEYTFDDEGRLTRMVERDIAVELPGTAPTQATYTTEYRYNAAGQLEETIHPRGNRTRWLFTETANPRLAGDVRELQRLEGFGAGGGGDLSWTFGRDYLTGTSTTETDPEGHTWTTQVNARGELVRREGPSTPDHAAPVWTYEYNAFGQLGRETLPEGGYIRYEYHPETRPGGIVTTPNAVGLDTATGGYLHRVWRSVGSGHPEILVSEQYYDARGNEVELRGPLGERTLTRYNDRDQPLEVTRVWGDLSYPVRMRYDEQGNVVERRQLHTGAGGDVVTTFTHDPLGKVLTETVTSTGLDEPLVTTHEYDGNRNETRTIPPEVDRAVDLAYDGRDRLVRRTQGGLVEAFAYDASNNRTRVYSPRGAAGGDDGNDFYWTEYEFDAHDRLVREIDPTGARTLLRYDDDSTLVEKRRLNAVGETVSLQTVDPDAHHRPRRELDYLFVEPIGEAAYPDNALETLRTYDGLGRERSVRDPEGHLTQQLYDDLDRLVRVDGPLGQRTELTLDAAGNVLVELNHEPGYPGGGTSSTSVYDGFSRLLSRTDAAGHATTWTYDSLDNVLSVTDAKGRTTTSTYDAANRLLAVVQPFDERSAADPDSAPGSEDVVVASYTYDKDGLPLSMTDGRGNTTTFEYEPGTGRLSRVVYPATDAGPQAAESFLYDGDGAVRQRTDPNGTVTTLTLDKLSRPTRVGVERGAGVATVLPGAESDPGYVEFEEYDWDALSRPTRTENPVATVTRRFDSLSRLVEETQGDRPPLTFGYDGDSLRTGIEYPSGLELTYDYDALHRLFEVRAGSEVVLGQTFVGPGRRDERRHGSAVVERLGYASQEVLPVRVRVERAGAPSPPLLELEGAVDSTHRVTSQVYHHAGGVLDEFNLNRRDQVDRATFGRTAPSEYHHRVTTALDAVLNAKAILQAVPEVGATRRLPVAVNARNQYEEFGGAELEYDRNGNLTRDDRGRTLAYDFRNRLVRMSGLADGSEADFHYDAEGRRMKKVRRPASGPEEVTVYLLEGDQVLEERDGAGVVLARYVVAEEQDDLCLMERREDAAAPWVRSYLHQAGPGSVGGLTDADGNLHEEYRYGLYGDVRILTPPALAQVRSTAAAELRLRFTAAATASALELNAVRILDAADLPLVEASRSLSDDGMELTVVLETAPAPGATLKMALYELLRSRDGLQRFVDEVTPVTFAPGSVLADLRDPRVERVVQDSDFDLIVTFDEAIDGATLPGGIQLLDASDQPAAFTHVLSSDGMRLEIDPGLGELAPGQRYRLVLAASVRDRGGRALAGSRVFPFDASTDSVLVFLRSLDDPEAGRSARGNPYLFQSREYDPETGLYFFRARYLDPRLQRFLQNDPLGYEDGPNMYAAFAGDPLTNRDPEGTAVETVWDVASLGMGVYSLYRNLEEGNWDAALVDTFGIVVDAAAAAVPFVPGGVGAAIKAKRAGKALCAMGRAGRIAHDVDTVIELGQAVNAAIGVGQSMWGAAESLREGDYAGAFMQAASGAVGARQLRGKTDLSGNLTSRRASIPCGRCFAAGTLVWTDQGPKPIEEIEVGDLVLAGSDETGEIGWRPVVETFRTEDRVVVDLDVETESGAKSRLRTTPDHPFWVKDRGWVDELELMPGDQVFSVASGWLRVGSAVWAPVRQPMYNFEVDGFHSYFVGAVGVWVHNPSCIQTNRTNGNNARDAIADRRPRARTEVTIKAGPRDRVRGVDGARRVDVMTQHGSRIHSIESKVGRTSLGTKKGAIRQELARDWWSRRRAVIDGQATRVDTVTWAFSRSPITGRIGPTRKLEEKLRKLGFNIVFIGPK